MTKHIRMKSIIGRMALVSAGLVALVGCDSPNAQTIVGKNYDFVRVLIKYCEPVNEQYRTEIKELGGYVVHVFEMQNDLLVAELPKKVIDNYEERDCVKSIQEDTLSRSH